MAQTVGTRLNPTFVTSLISGNSRLIWERFCSVKLLLITVFACFSCPLCALDSSKDLRLVDTISYYHIPLCWVNNVVMLSIFNVIHSYHTFRWVLINNILVLTRVNANWNKQTSKCAHHCICKKNVQWLKSCSIIMIKKSYCRQKLFICLNNKTMMLPLNIRMIWHKL